MEAMQSTLLKKRNAFGGEEISQKNGFTSIEQAQASPSVRAETRSFPL